MASSRDRQRKLARAKLDRQMARRAATVRRKRQIRAGIGSALALLLIVLGSFWALGGFDRESADDTAAETCAWTSQDAQANTNLKDVGTPPTRDLPTTGTRPMTITTNQGAPVTVELDLANAPCAAASFTHLAGKSFFDNTKCHELTSEGRCAAATRAAPARAARPTRSSARTPRTPRRRARPPAPARPPTRRPAPARRPARRRPLRPRRSTRWALSP
ncbi:hypothetical protein GCM10027615_67150 [Plantactinospora veratri]